MALPTVKPGCWFRLPGTRLRAIEPDPIPPGSTSGFGGFLAEGGGAYDSDEEEFLIKSGGHADYSGNGHAGFSTKTLKWRWVWPGTPNDQIPMGGENYNKYLDGQPSSRHTRDGLEYLPDQKAFWMHGGSVWKNGGNARDTWIFRTGTTAWVQRSSAPDTEFTNVYSAYDPVSKTVLVIRPQSLATKTLVYRYDPASDVWTKLSTSAYFDQRRTAAFDSKRKKLLMAGFGQFVVWDLNTLAPGVVVKSGLTGVLGRVGPGLEYDPRIDLYVAWYQGPNGLFYINPDSFNFEQAVLPADSAIPPDTHGGGNTGSHGRFRRDPKTGYYLAVNHVDDDVYVFNPVLEGGSMPASVTVNVATTPQSGFPDGTVGGLWRIKLTDGPDPRTQDTQNPTFTFSNVAPGTYNATGQRLSTTGTFLGPETKTAQPFTVPADVTITIQVAAGTTVQVIQNPPAHEHGVVP